jgi:glycosyltransferase involved in cell wall biosynthesis
MGTALAGIFSGPRPDLLLVYSPPLFLGVTATMVSKVWGCPFIFWVNDLWPRAALSLGFMQDNFAYRLACRLESFIYHQAARIFVYSQRMAAEVAKTGVDSAKIEYHPLWIDTDVFQPRPDAAKEIRRQYGWGERFVVLYGGNLGLAQGLDVLIETARLCRSLPDIHFVLVGSGVEKENLENLVKHYGLTNVEFIGHQPKDKVGTFFSAADLLFAHLKAAPHRVGTVPEKILAYMACGRPVLLGAQEGAAADLIQEHRCGLAVPPDDPQALAQAIESLLSHRQQIGQMGNQGRQAAEVHFSGPTVLKAMEASFLMLT